MVRTLDFHSKNGGSIPPGPIIPIKFNTNYAHLYKPDADLLNKTLTQNPLTLTNENRKTCFNFLFVSLISPFFSQNLVLLNQAPSWQKKILLKQSYILLTWVYHLSFVESKKNKKARLAFFVLPVQRRVFTLTKAPIAHKNWSKEQYQTKFYKLKISFSALIDEDFKLNSVDAAALFALITKKQFPNLETNVLFLKYYTVFFHFSDCFYFNFYKFVSKPVEFKTQTGFK